MNVGSDQQELSNLIGAIYDCAIDPGQWPATLQRLAGALGGCNGTILSHGVDTVSFTYHWGTPDHALRAYADTYARIDPLMTIGWHFEIDDPVSLERFMTPDELRATRFYQAFLAPLDWYDFAAVIIEKSATRSSTVGFTRTTAMGAPDARQKALLRLLAPHLRRTVIFHGIKERDAARAADLRAALDLMRVPIVLADAEGRCVETNVAADQFMATTNAIRLARGGVLVGNLSTTAELATALTTNEPTRTMSFALTQTDGRRFAAHVMPLTGALRDRMAGGSNVSTALFIQPVGDLQPLPGEVLVKLYGLTPAETRLLALLGQDLSLDETAATLGITMPTARTHLQRIFQKTNTNRQSQLVRLVLSALPRPPS
ncbi:MAG: helix-turn-helix transcriptional regulator [Acetobacteraceae bacterium]